MKKPQKITQQSNLETFKKNLSVPVDQKGKKVFRYQFDPNYKGSKGEPGGGKSMTQPNHAIPLKVLVEKHTRNGIVPNVGSREGYYFDGVTVPRVNDLTDIEKNKRILEEEASKLNDKIDKELAIKQIENSLSAAEEKIQEEAKTT